MSFTRPSPQVRSPARCTIVPGYLLQRMAAVEPLMAADLMATAEDAERVRSRRELRGTRWPGGRPTFLPPGMSPLSDITEPGLRPDQGAPAVAEGPPALPQPHRTVHDAQHGTTLPGAQARGEGEPVHADESVNEAFDGLGHTWDLLHRAYGRDSLDGRGLPLVATVHYGRRYDNAFWDGGQMVFGDGDGTYFRSFTDSVDVIGHELAHGLVQFTAGLTYVGQPGALNEHVSDVIGSLVRQWVRGETAQSADWLIGAELFTDRVQGVALRSMSAPGTAYDDPVLGKDPQPGHWRDYVELPHDAGNDNGGVHINSGIPNKAFHLVATALGGSSWERAGQVWVDVLTTAGTVPRDVDFAGFAAATLTAAAARYGADSEVERAVRDGWEGVGVVLQRRKAG